MLLLGPLLPDLRIKPWITGKCLQGCRSYCCYSGQGLEPRAGGAQAPPTDSPSPKTLSPSQDGALGSVCGHHQGETEWHLQATFIVSTLFRMKNVLWSTILSIATTTPNNSRLSPLYQEIQVSVGSKRQSLSVRVRNETWEGSAWERFQEIGRNMTTSRTSRETKRIVSLSRHGMDTRVSEMDKGVSRSLCEPHSEPEAEPIRRM